MNTRVPMCALLSHSFYPEGGKIDQILTNIQWIPERLRVDKDLSRKESPSSKRILSTVVSHPSFPYLSFKPHPVLLLTQPSSAFQSPHTHAASASSTTPTCLLPYTLTRALPFISKLASSSLHTSHAVQKNRTRGEMNPRSLAAEHPDQLFA